MNFELMSKEDLIEYIKNINESNNGKYGLIWDKEKETEKIVEECNKYIPVLKEEENKRLENGGENNILIEGDNFHALSVLNYTHKEAIDIIYIDPPYNTGNEDFVYNDKFIDVEDGYRHSKWLNFMEKRLKIARDLLKDDGIIFISIDDNELFQLKLLCDKIFGSNNYINLISVNTKNNAGASGGGEDTKLKKNIEYVLIYAKKYNEVSLNTIYEYKELYPLILDYKENGISWKYNSILVSPGEKEYITSTMDGHNNEIKIYRRKNYIIKSIKQFAQDKGISEEEVYNKYYEKIYRGTMPQSSIRPRVLEKLNELHEECDLISIEYIPISGKNRGKIYEQFYSGENLNLFAWLKDVVIEQKGKIYKKEQQGTLWDMVGETKNLSKEGNIKFENGKKPIKLIKQLISLHTNKNAIILDFFAGSGSTGHAVLDLNKEDNGKRKFILCTNNEVSKKLQNEFKKKYKLTEKEFNKLKETKNQKWIKYSTQNGICTAYTFPRLKNVIKGVNGKVGLKGTLRYYKTEFVDNNVTKDQIYYDLTEKCIPMLCIKENTYIDIEKNDQYAIFSNNEKNKFTCVYFDTIGNKYDEFIEKVKNINENKILYIFTLGNKIEEPRLVDIKNYRIEAIPQRIYDLYRKLAKMSKEM